MRNSYLMLFGIIFISVVLLLLYAPVTSADPAIMISNYELSPKTLMPGDSAILTLTVTNAESTATRTTVSTSGSTTTTTVKTIGAEINNIWIVPDGSGDKEIHATSNYQDVGYMAPGASLEVSFKLIADENISEGLYFPTARIDVEDYEDVKFPLLVKVSNASVDLLPTNVPSKISASGSTEITLTAINNRDSTVDDVVVTPGKIDGVEFIPNSAFIGTLGSGESEEVSFSVKPSEVETMNLSFDVSYKNGDNLHNNTLTVSIDVIESLDVAPIIYDIPSSIEKGSSTKIRLEVYNAKTESITGVIVTPVTNATVVPSQYFIGSMDPDDVFSASFDIYTDNLEYKNYTIGF
ncbi:MAG: hypothetical protein DRO67_03040, partial [Candidatus Asgardarchaeum californiense]